MKPPNRLYLTPIHRKFHFQLLHHQTNLSRYECIHNRLRHALIHTRIDSIRVRMLSEVFHDESCAVF